MSHISHTLFNNCVKDNVYKDNFSCVNLIYLMKSKFFVI